ncbi:16S rRNA (uracil(1498)-N(3))-methyltransferase [Simiduia litorea]
MGQAVVTAVDENQVTLSQVMLSQEPPTPLPLHLLLALPRPKMLRRIFQTAATMGVKEITLINAYKVEKSYWQTPFLQAEKIREQLILGLEQAKDTLLPSVTFAKRFKPYVEDELSLICQGKQNWIAHPYQSQACPRDQSLYTPSSLAIGPEGGFIEYEVEKLNAIGFQSIGLGDRILRVETALPVLLAKLFNT